MAEKVAKLGIARDKDFMFYVKDGSVWRVKRKQAGAAKGKPEQVAEGGFTMDYSYIYFVDRDGDVSRAKRAVGGQKRKAPRAKKAAKKATRKTTRKATKKPARKTTAATAKANAGRKPATGRSTARKAVTGSKRIGPKASKPRATKSKAAARKKRS